MTTFLYYAMLVEITEETDEVTKIGMTAELIYRQLTLKQKEYVIKILCELI